jgi:hypothetical protein
VQNPNILFFHSFLQIDNGLLDGFLGFDNAFIGLPCPKKIAGIRLINERPPYSSLNATVKRLAKERSEFSLLRQAFCWKKIHYLSNSDFISCSNACIRRITFCINI